MKFLVAAFVVNAIAFTLGLVDGFGNFMDWLNVVIAILLALFITIELRRQP